MIHRKKNRPALQRRDILTVSLVSFPFFIGNLLNSSSIQFLVVLFFLAFYTALFSSKHLAFSARACSLAFLSLWVSFLAISRAVLIYLVLFSGLSKAFLSLVILFISAFLRPYFSYSSQGFFVGLLLPRFFYFFIFFIFMVLFFLALRM